MTYAQARLCLGITGVGVTVVVAAAMLIGQTPLFLFSNANASSWADVAGLVSFVAGFLVLMAPFDLLGGYWLPRRFGRHQQRFAAFASRWLVGVGLQSSLFVLTGLGILAAGRLGGTPAALALVAGVAIAYLVVQGALARLVTRGFASQDIPEISAVEPELKRWGRPAAKILVIDHEDPGFTGGVIGCPGFESLVIPRRWLTLLSPQELAIAIARRLEAVHTGSRFRGVLLALTWILSGFLLATLLPGAGVGSVAQLVMTCCGFTLWMFVGLLTLPTVSRDASYAIDQSVVERGVPAELLHSTLLKLDTLQDDESQRPVWVERIFHPVPSVDNRRRRGSSNAFGAWHAARMTLFLSWACLGLLSRAVHCNAGRPELWVMLPTD